MAQNKQTSSLLPPPPSEEELELLRKELKREPSPPLQGLPPPPSEEQLRLLREGEPAGEDYLGAALRGAQRQLAPYTMEQDKVSDTTGEKVTEVASNIGTAVAGSMAAAALGGAVAGPVGAFIGPLALGAYTGIAEEYARAKQDDREFDWKKAAVNVLAESVPGLGKMKVIPRALTAGALTAGQSAQYGGRRDDIILAGVLGGGLTAAGGLLTARKNAKAVEMTANLTEDAPDVVAKNTRRVSNALDVNEQAADEALKMEQQLRKKYAKKDELLKQAIVSPSEKTEELIPLLTKNKIHPDQVDIRNEQVLKWARNATGRHEAESIDEALARTGITREMAYDGYLMSRYKKAAGRRARSNILGIRDSVEAFHDRFLERVEDARYVARRADRLSKVTSFEVRMDDLAKAMNRHHAFTSQLITDANILERNTRKAGLSLERVTEILDEASKLGKLPDRLNDAQREAMSGWIDIHNRLFDEGLKAGIFRAKQKIPFYYHHTRVDLPTAVKRTRSQLRNLVQMADESADPEATIARYMRSSEGKDLRKFLGIVAPKTPETTSDLVALDRLLGSRDMLKRIRKEMPEVSAAYERTGELPLYLKESNVGRAFTQYVNEVSRAIHLSQPIAKMRTDAMVLRSLGGEKTAKYFDQLADDSIGIGYQPHAGIQALKDQFRTNFGDLKEYSQLSWLGKTAYQLPDLGKLMMQQPYVAFLGLRADAPVRNLTQPNLMTATDLAAETPKGLRGKASAYYQNMALKAQGKAALKTFSPAGDGKTLPISRPIKYMYEVLKEEGRVPPKFLGESFSLLDTSIAKTPGPLGAVVKGTEKFNDVAMAAYAASDVVNRYITRQMGKDIVADALKGHKVANATLSNISGAYGRKIRQAMAAGDWQAVEDGLIDYLIGKTQFHYGKHAASQFSREFGPLVSMFAKWPSSIVGDLGEKARRKDISGIFHKYMGPLAALVGIHATLNATAGDTPERRALLGRSVINYGPVLSATSLMQQHPVLGSLGGLARAGTTAVDGDIDRAMYSTIKQVTPFLPVAGPLFHAYERHQKLIEGEE